MPSQSENRGNLSLCFAAGSHTQSWKDIYVQGRRMTNDCALELIAPEINKEGKHFAKIYKLENTRGCPEME